MEMKHKAKVEFLYLSQQEVIDTGLDISVAISQVEKVLGLEAKGHVISAGKTVLDLDQKKVGRINALPAYVGGDIDICGIKWIAGFPHNPTNYGLPRASGLIVLNEATTGIPVCVMDGTLIGALRTGASTGVAAKYLANADSSIVGIIGCGVQAVTQVAALTSILSGIQTMKLYDINRRVADSLESLLVSSYPGMRIVNCKTAEEAVEGADVVATLTSADEPIVQDRWLKQGVFLSQVGSYQEEEEAVVLNADKVVVDKWKEVLEFKTPLIARMFRNGQIDETRIHGELGEIINGLTPGRERPEERIYYSQVGLGSEDVAVASWVFHEAREKGLGRELVLWEGPMPHLL